MPPKNDIVLKKKKKKKRNSASGFLRDRFLQPKSCKLQSNVGLALQGRKPAQRVEEVFSTPMPLNQFPSRYKLSKPWFI